ncbi:MAG: UV DNA damage repair endonuclease UvsE [Desulfobulbaceae bacterium]|nr:UV DNA damage repair endonuclease UvsE [Desulfobulbaceae bacterium]
METAGKLRLGLCCIFRKEPIRFRQITAKTLRPLSRPEQLNRLSAVCLHNARNILASLQFVRENGIGAYRIPSPLFPRYTHPEVGYHLTDLPDSDEIGHVLEAVRFSAQNNDIRLSFHPDQFNVLSSPRVDVAENTRKELAYQAMLAELVGAEVINLHAGGAYGDKNAALERLRQNVQILPESVLGRLSLENDDVSFAPADLLSVCESLGIPMVYDVHHHRCLPDGFSVLEVTERVVRLWESLGREPYFHISSPRNGWHTGSPKPHADYIDPADFPPCWHGLRATIDVEAKAKELAVLKLRKDLAG